SERANARPSHSQEVIGMTAYEPARETAESAAEVVAPDADVLVVSSWLMGQDPPAFDILAWNGDSTRMPAAMHSFYLRSLYMRNELARGGMELAGQRLSLSDVKSDTYVVGAINDHIVPWHGSYKTGGL